MNLTTQVSTAYSLIKFVTGEQLHDALTAIGDNHFHTAERVLRNLPKAHDQAALLRIGISHLEGAHTAYKQWYSSEGGKFMQKVFELSLPVEDKMTALGVPIRSIRMWRRVPGLTDVFNVAYRPFSYMTACKKDVYTCCLLAACYAYLKEEELVHLAIEHAEAAQQQFILVWGKEDFDETPSFDRRAFFLDVWDIPALSQLRKVPKVSLPDYKNNLLRILPELCNR